MLDPIDPSVWTCSPYFVALVLLSFGKGCLADLAFAQALQNSGFESLSSLIPVINPFNTALILIFPEAVAAWPLLSADFALDILYKPLE